MTNSTYIFYGSQLPISLSVDPLTDQTMTPYQYTYQNPINLVDPTGMAAKESLVDDPIYGVNFWGNLKYLGDDGKNIGRVYFVSGQTKRDVKNATANGEFYTGNLNSSSEVSSVPSQMIFAVDNSLRATLSSGKDNGGHNTFSSFKTTQWDEGPEIQRLQVAEGILTKGSVVPFVVDGNRLNIDLSDLDVYYHLHPDNKGLGSSLPSNYTVNGSRQRRGDIPFQANLESRGYRGNPFVVGAKDRKVNFYNGNGSVTKVKYEQFRIALLSEFFKHLKF